MHIAIDIDDTLTDTFSYLLPYMIEYFKWDEEAVRKNATFYSSLPLDWWEHEEEFARRYYDRIIPNVPMKEGAVYYVNKLREEGHRITILTARTQRFYADPYRTCKESLDKNGLHYDEIICSGDKGQVCKDKGVDVLIDDWWVNCEAAQKAGTQAILFTGGHKMEQAEHFVCADTWAQVYARVQALATLVLSV